MWKMDLSLTQMNVELHSHEMLKEGKVFEMNFFIAYNKIVQSKIQKSRIVYIVKKHTHYRSEKG